MSVTPTGILYVVGSVDTTEPKFNKKACVCGTANISDHQNSDVCTLIGILYVVGPVDTTEPKFNKKPCVCGGANIYDRQHSDVCTLISILYVLGAVRIKEPLFYKNIVFMTVRLCPPNNTHVGSSPYWRDLALYT
ncbi:hypothetical protein J6590_097002, partial [Homalodisca vitripennis]